MGGRGEAPNWPMAARDAELEALLTAWAEPDCQTLVVFGPAGVGKSRLAEECLARFVRAGFHGTRATASAAAAAVPLGAVARLIPPEADLSDPVRGFAEVARALAARRRRQAVLVDDADLLDGASAVLLRQLLDAGVIRLIATVRTGRRATGAVTALIDSPYRLDLAPFGQGQVGQVLESALGGPVGRRTVRTLFDASGGNALYLRELVHGALRAGALTRGGGIWELAEGAPPGTPRLMELITARLEAAPSGARPVLELLALCEPLSPRDAGPLEVLSALEDSGLVSVLQDGRRTAVSLAHPLYGEALRAALPDDRRRALLRGRVARLEEHGARRHDDPLHLATWRLSAGGEADPALLARAAALARHAHDYDRALPLARAAWRQQPTARTGLVYAASLIDLARHEDAESVLRRAEPLAAGEDRESVFGLRLNNFILRGELRDAQHLLRGRDDPQSRLSMAGVLYYRGRLRESAGHCRALLDGPDPAVAQDARTFAASCLYRRGLIAEGDEVFAPTRALLARGGERADSLYAEFIEHVDAYGRLVAGDVRAAEGIMTSPYERALARRQSEAHSAVSLGYILMERGRPRTAINVLHPVATRRTHWDVFTRWGQADAVICAASLGRPDLADRYLDLLPEPGDDIEACSNRTARAWRAALDGDLDRAGSLLREAAEEARALGQNLHQTWAVHAMGRLGVAELAEPYWDVAVEGGYLNAHLDYTRAVARRDDGLTEHVAEAFHAAGADLYAAEAYAVLAGMLAGRGLARRATAAADHAVRIAAACEGAVTPPLALLAAVAPPARLTAREREIVRLAAGGAASKDIAASLRLSVRTVDNHLQRVYTKLGVTTRRELVDALDRIGGREADR